MFEVTITDCFGEPAHIALRTSTNTNEAPHWDIVALDEHGNVEAYIADLFLDEARLPRVQAHGSSGYCVVIETREA